MRFGLDILSTYLNYFGTRKVLSSSDSTHLPNIFAERNTRVAGRSRSARLHAAKSAARLHKHRSIASAAPSSTEGHIQTAGIGATHKVKQHGTKYRRAKMRTLAGKKPFQRCNTVLVPRPPTHPQPPGAFVADPSFVVPGFPRLDDRDLPPFVAQKLFFDALDDGRQALLRAEEEQRKRKKKAEHARKVEQDSKARAQAARRRAEEDAERVRLREEEWRKAEATRRQVEMENSLRKAEEAHRLAEQERQHRAEQEREAIKRERREHEAAAAQTAQLDPLMQLLCVYEDKWKVLHGNTVRVGSLCFKIMPWPSLEHVKEAVDITDDHVHAFLSHLGRFKGCNGKRAQRITFIRSELLRWHPDKFEGQVLNKVIEGDRKETCEAAVHITRVLNKMLKSAVESSDNE